MNAPVRKPGLFKPGYEGVQPAPRLTPQEVQTFEARKDALIRRLHDAMLTMSVLQEDDPSGRGSGWPGYLREFSDLVGRGEDGEPVEETRPSRFSPKPHMADDLLAALALVDGLRPIHTKVLFMRAIGEYFGGFSFDAIGDRYGKSGQWARSVYDQVVIIAARRDGLLDPEPRGWAIFVASVWVHGQRRTWLTTAADPAAQLRDLRSKSPIGLADVFVVWTPGRPVAQRLVKAARAHLLGKPKRGSWHMISPDDMADLLIGEARKIRAEWSIENLEVGQQAGLDEDEV